MKHIKTYIILSGSLFLTTQCSHLTELTPIRQHTSPYPELTDMGRKELVETTKDLPDWAGCCTLNSEKQEYLKQLFYPGGRWDKPGNIELCTLKMLYTHGCACESPCKYIAACGVAGVAATAGLIATTTYVSNSSWLAAIVPLSLTIGTSSLIATCCGVSASCDPKKNKSSCHLDYITNPENWLVSNESEDNTYDHHWLDQDYDYD